jgi:hypothetical protein
MKSVTYAVILIIAGCWFCFASDKEDKKKESQTQTQTEPIVSYEILQKGTMSGVREPLAKIITTKDEWQSFWKRHVSTLVPQPPAPDVDFDTHVLAIVFMGEKKTGGYQVVIKNVEAKVNDVVIHYHEAEPASNSFNLQVLTQPFVILKIAKPTGSVILTKE